MASSPHSEGEEDDSAVCCMCGDHGLARELFRCRSCRARLQHSYCSELYPRATAYKRCNWCLAAVPVIRHQQAGATTKLGKAEATTTASSDEEQQRRELGRWSARRPPRRELISPVKKKKQRINKAGGDEKAAPPADDGAGAKETAGRRRCATATAPPGASGDNNNKEMMRAGKTTRVKVRRYKLLAEVISC